MDIGTVLSTRQHRLQTKRSVDRRRSGSGSAGAVRWGAATDVGRIREQNEDAFAVREDLGLFVVSDGMGGHAGGKVAAGTVVQALPLIVEKRFASRPVRSARAIKRRLDGAVRQLNRYLISRARKTAGCEDMGATVVCGLWVDGRVYVANLGDSRAYLLHSGRIRRLSLDHSVVHSLVLQGLIEPHEANSHPARGQLIRYVGMEQENAKPHVTSLTPKAGDCLLLCSDGLTDLVSDSQMAAILGEHADPQAAAERLVRAANSAGGHDNITAMVMRGE